jgi:hypothetical protein
VWTLTHFVRSRPARYPPNPADTHCVTTNQMAAPAPNVVADTPELLHGEIEVNPRPVPKTKRMRAVAAAATPPAMIADQVTPDEETSPTPTATGEFIVLSMCAPLVVEEKREKNDDWDRHAEQPE